ncbi:hypothetical protein ILUMI_09894 [Ignelater luminosus]|uniref:LisH domain-containing protein n=1 Tax=Ignelater luminosus TaxID=2038154 RepID=A0A8K0G978_IGNLU|nr:hypothetical protein ILUMI_09894 [Ignelater luminosus]
MDLNLSYTISNEDLVSVLRTILLFLENINFKATSAVLQQECTSKGYPEIELSQAKIVIVHPITSSCARDVEQCHKDTQTEIPISPHKSYVLESSVHVISNDSEEPSTSNTNNPVCIYYTDVQNFSVSKSSHDNVCDKDSRDIVSSDNVEPCNDSALWSHEKCRVTECSTAEGFIEEHKDIQNKSPNKKKPKKLDNKRSPNTIESEYPTRISSKKCLVDETQQSKENCLRKTHSNPSLKSNSAKNIDSRKTNGKGDNSRCPSVDSKQKPEPEECKCKELKKKFRQLQMEHQKLMGVTTELTTALQTHILGQSENLNSMLNNCRNIYPDLFRKSVCVQHCSDNPNSPNVSDENVEENKFLKDRSVQASCTSSFETEINATHPREPLYTTVPRAHFIEDTLDDGHEGGKIKNDSTVASPSKLDTIKSNENNCKTTNTPEPSNSQGVNVESTQTDDSAKNNEGNSNVSIEIATGIDLCHTTVKTSKLKRPHSSSIILITTTDDEQNSSSNLLLRKLSSRSCDECLIINTSKESQMHSEDTNEDEITVSHKEQETEKNIMANTATQLGSEIPNSDFESKENNLTCDENNAQRCKNTKNPPEVFVTTENMEKVQRKCRCSTANDSNQNSPRSSRYFDLDFKKLKKDMLTGSDDLKLSLVQALRWRITQSDSETRDQVISSYIRHDLLGLHSAPNPCGQSALEVYYSPNSKTPHPLQEGMARLVNAFASLTLGRDYLCQDDDLLVSLLIPLVIGTHYSKVEIDEITRDMIMATLQKLSIRNKQRLKMIAAGLVEHLVTFLSTKHNTISEYCMEYTTALLMNLCLHEEARERLHPFATDVVSLLADLLDTKRRYCMPYVNGTMFSLLSDSYINNEAKRLNLAQLIEYHIARTDGEIQRQLQFILKLHWEGNEDKGCQCDSSIEPEYEVDLLEPELDNDDSIKTEPSGEDFLTNYKLLFSVYGSQVYATHLQCLCRPVTPIPRSAENMIRSDDNNNISNNQAPRCSAKRATSKPKEDPTNSNKNQHKKYISPKPCYKGAACRNKPNSSKNKNDSDKTFKKSSPQSSRSNSPEMSYSEETKQFYHIPSSKTSIFDSYKTKKLHRVPPSFTRTIAMPTRMINSPSVCNNPHCPHPYSKTPPTTPKENSSVRNPPYMLDYQNSFGPCYRENYMNQNWCKHLCDCNKSKNKYVCNCYNVIKGFVDQIEQQNANLHNSSHNNKSNTNVKIKRTNVNFGQGLSPSELGMHANHVQFQGKEDAANQFVTFTYEELVNNGNIVEPDHICPNAGSGCQCYETVFQSRPKILRTPP